MFPLSRSSAIARQPASDMLSHDVATQSQGPTQASTQASVHVSTALASPRLKTPACSSELTGVDRLQRESLARTTFSAAATASVAVQSFDEKLTEWEWSAPRECLPHERKYRREAAHRIRCLREDNADSLDLDDLYMTSLPPCLAELPSLRRLNVGCNNLKTLPDLPTGLTHLYVHGNQLTHLPHLPATLQLLVADPGVMHRSLQALEEKIVALGVELTRLTQPPAPVTGQDAARPALLAAQQHSDDSTSQLERLGPQLIGAVTAWLTQASADGASLSASGKCFHAVVQPGLDIGKNLKDTKTAQEQIATLNRLALGRAT